MKSDTIQPVIGDLSRWIVTKDPTPEFWTYNLLDFGLYSDSGIANQLISAYRTTEFQSSLKEMASELTSGPTKGEVTVRFFYSAYQSDAEACLGLMNQVYQAYKKDGVDFDEYPALQEIENKDITDPDYNANNIEYNPRVEKVYTGRSKFDVYLDVHNAIQEVEDEVIIFDPYVNEDLIELYLERLPLDINIRILTKNIQGDFEPVSQKFREDDGRWLQVRTHDKVHDRFLFVDERCFVLGNSVTNAGGKPTYFVELEKSKGLKNIFEDLWKKGAKAPILQ